MKSKFWFALLVLGSLHFVAAAQAPLPPKDVVKPAPKGTERTVNADATPAHGDLLLYAEPSETSKTTKFFGSRPIHIYSEIDSTWYRTVHGGAQFFVKRADVTLVVPGAKKAPARRR